MILFAVALTMFCACAKDECIYELTRDIKTPVIKAKLSEDTKLLIQELENNAFKITGFETGDMLVVYIYDSSTKWIEFQYDANKEEFIYYNCSNPRNIPDLLENSICFLNYDNSGASALSTVAPYYGLHKSDHPTYSTMKILQKLPLTGVLKKVGDEWCVNLKADDYALLCITNNSESKTAKNCLIKLSTGTVNYYLRDSECLQTNWEFSNDEYGVKTPHSISFGNVNMGSTSSCGLSIKTGDIRYFLLPIRYARFASTAGKKPSEFLSNPLIQVRIDNQVIKERLASDIKPGKVYNITIQ